MASSARSGSRVSGTGTPSTDQTVHDGPDAARSRLRRRTSWPGAAPAARHATPPTSGRRGSDARRAGPCESGRSPWEAPPPAARECSFRAIVATSRRLQSTADGESRTPGIAPVCRVERLAGPQRQRHAGPDGRRPLGPGPLGQGPEARRPLAGGTRRALPWRRPIFPAPSSSRRSSKGPRLPAPSSSTACWTSSTSPRPSSSARASGRRRSRAARSSEPISPAPTSRGPTATAPISWKRTSPARRSRDVNFRGVKTTGAHFDGADLSRSLFEGVTLARGLLPQRELHGSEPEDGGLDGRRPAPGEVRPAPSCARRR